MTLYWWNHWFWITLITVIATLPFTSVATYPMSSPSLEEIDDIIKNNNQNMNKNSKLPLEFPLAAQTDVDDIVTGSENIPRTLIIKEQIIEKFNRDIKDEIASGMPASSLSSIAAQDKRKIQNQLNDRNVKEVNQSIEDKKLDVKDDDDDDDMKLNTSGNTTNNSNNNNNNNSKNNNNPYHPDSSKSVIQLIPKATKTIKNENNKKELDSEGIENVSMTESSIIKNIKQETESLDVVSYDNNNNKNKINDTNNRNVSNISTNILLDEKTHENLIVSTTLSPTNSTTTVENSKSISHIMQVTKSSSKIRSKTSISDDNESNITIAVRAPTLDETTIGSDEITMTTILHPLDEIDSKNDTNNGLISEPLDDNMKVESRSDDVSRKISITLENVTKLSDKNLSKESERVRKSKGLSSEYRDAFINNYSSDAKSLLTRSAGQEEDFNIRNEENGGKISSEALQIKRAYVMDAGTISGICVSVLATCCGVGFIGIVLYRRRFLNKPQALSEPDSSVYIDDTTIRDNSDEMYSLDNDSFLNSLEAMTIQNYWTDTVKHTKL